MPGPGGRQVGYAAGTLSPAPQLVSRRRVGARSLALSLLAAITVAAGPLAAQPGRDLVPPVEPTPVEPAPAEPAPVEPAPVEPPGERPTIDPPSVSEGPAPAVVAVIPSTATPPEADDARLPWRLEVGGFLGLDYFGDDIELGNSWASEQIPGTSLLLGARAAFIPLRDLAPGSSLDPQLGVEVEAKLALSSTGSATEGGRASYFAPVLGWRAHLLARLGNSSAWTPHLVIGLGGESVITGSPFMADDTDAAFHWGPGVSRPLFGRWDLRVDLRHGLTAGRVDGVVSTFELHAGLSTGWDLPWPRRAVAKVLPPDVDTDGDGIFDREDQCPTEVETVNDFQDKDGCPDVADRDGDGIMDPDDQCIDEPETVNGVDDTDGCPEIDEDGDGRVGSADACPKEAEDFDRYQDEDGCPDPDNDSDGVLDTVDVCPSDPETRNGFDDDDGCPDELPKVVREFTGAIDGITFATGKAVVRPPSRKTLDKAAAILREYASIQIRIEGHTDTRGKRELNIDLSQRRADAVRRYLVDKGIAESRITTVGHGPDVPRDSNKTARGRAKNRRIEFHVIVQEPIVVPMPGVPTTQPSVPATQPSEAATQPSEAATQPAAPATQPTAPTP